MNTESASRDTFEERIFNHRFLKSIGPVGNEFGPVGMPLGMSRDCPTMAEFCRKDEAGNYLEPFVAGAWWAWTKKEPGHE